MRGPAFAAVARDVGRGLLHLLDPESSSATAVDVLRAAAVRSLAEEAEEIARGFDAWTTDPATAEARVALVNQLAKLKKRVSAVYG
jgi:hypothetical protein